MRRAQEDEEEFGKEKDAPVPKQIVTDDFRCTSIQVWIFSF